MEKGGWKVSSEANLKNKPTEEQASEQVNIRAYEQESIRTTWYSEISDPTM